MADEGARIEAVAALYAAAELERLRVYEVLDRLVELWLAGGLAFGAGRASAGLDGFWLESNARMSDEQRRGLYSALFGAGNGAFADLFRRLLDALAQRNGADAVTAARDLRANLSEHAGEEALAAAPVLTAQLRGALDILSEPEVLSAYGAQDVWQLVDHLIRREGGEPPDVSRIQARAAAGASVLVWLARDDLRADDEVAGAAASWLAANGAG